jgi:hypothetical protein
MVKSNAWRSAEILSGGVWGVENSGLPMVAAAENRRRAARSRSFCA